MGWHAQYLTTPQVPKKANNSTDGMNYEEQKKITPGMNGMNVRCFWIESMSVLVAGVCILTALFTHHSDV
jgi:hypothetical protein